MVIWDDEWSAIEGRISGLQKTLMDFVVSVEHSQHSTYDNLAAGAFLPALRGAYAAMQAFATKYETVLPAAASARLAQLLADGRTHVDTVSGLRGVTILATLLSTYAAELLPLMRDTEVQRVHLAERAFLHLQRLIVADPDARTKWQRAYADGEVACERLGGAHLLHHGIYAIKSNSEGERTDLVLGTRLAMTARIRRSVDAMALTEWKLVRRPDQLSTAIADARGQATRYAAGSLAGFEISGVRFLVTVSADVLDEQPDEVVGMVTYRHVNIAVSPSTPSRS